MFDVKCAVDWGTFQERLNEKGWDCLADRENPERLLAINEDCSHCSSPECFLDAVFGGDWYQVRLGCQTFDLLKTFHSAKEVRS